MSLDLRRKQIQLIVIVLSFYIINCIELPTCCPLGYELIDIGRSQFRCGRNNDKQNTLISSPLNSYNIVQSSKSNLPQCDSPNGLKNCLSIVDGKYGVLSCPKKYREPSVRINLVKKCCPHGHSYNMIYKRCEKSKQFEKDNFEWLFNEPTIIENSKLECLSSSVIVDYFSSEYNISFHNSQLIVGTKKFQTDSFCVETIDRNSTSGDQYLFRTCNSPGICDRIPCVRRCCRYNEKLMRINGTPTCVPDPNDLHITFHNIYETKKDNFSIVVPKAFGVLQNQKCAKYPLNPASSEQDMYYFSHIDGTVYIPYQDNYVKNSDYCVQNIETETEFLTMTFICFDMTQKGLSKFRLYAICLLISCGFLSLTLLVYLCVPKLLNIHGKTLTCHVVSLLAAYLGLVVIQFSNLQFTLCYPFAFFIYFSFMAAFSWLNVMCFDIWWAFGSPKASRNMHDFHDHYRFLIYSVYAWGVPLLLTLITFTVDYFKLANDYFHPNIGEGRCWFSQTSSPPHFLFFLAPVGVLITTNFILFILTLRYCNQVKKEIYRMQSTCSEKKSLKKRFLSDKTRFAMNTKLFIVMGVSWIIEIISTIFSEHVEVWYVSDLFNVMQGVFIFFIFVFKRRVWTAILERFGVSTKSKYHPSRSTVATPTTVVTSTTDLRKIKSFEKLPLQTVRTPSTGPKFNI